MSIVSNYIWEKGIDGGKNPISLVLQQVKLRSREICMFCVCDSPKEDLGGQMTEQLVEWFHKSCLPACGGRTLPMPRDLLEQEMRDIKRELPRAENGLRKETLNYGGLLLAGSSFYLFGEGEIKVQLVNYRYNRPQLKELGFPMTGRMQRGVGLLLNTPLLTGNLKPQEVCQILHGGGQWQEERIGRRLRELYREGRSRGSTGPVGGIYLQVL